jgi:hypothetical protein
MWEILAPVFTVIAAVVAIFFRWRRWRESQLRLGEVLAWANEVIRELQGLVLVCQLNETQLEAAAAKAKLTEIFFHTSILVEQGRLFFKNKGKGGSRAEPAYQGTRPTILDQIILAHQIAFCLRDGTDRDTRLRMRVLAEECRRRFVSLAQKEVGRAQTASVEAGRPGADIRISSELAGVTADQVAQLDDIKR